MEQSEHSRAAVFRFDSRLETNWCSRRITIKSFAFNFYINNFSTKTAVRIAIEKITLVYPVICSIIIIIIINFKEFKLPLTKY